MATLAIRDTVELSAAAQLLQSIDPASVPGAVSAPGATPPNPVAAVYDARGSVRTLPTVGA